MTSLRSIAWSRVGGGALVLACLMGQAAWAAEQETRVAKKGGAQLWAQSCVRCHNIRSPSMYSDKEWDVIAHHMRVRANLTKEETEAIREYLKSGN